MKRILFSVLLALFSFSNLYAYDYVFNTVTKEGERRIVTERKKLFKFDKGKVVVSLGLKYSDEDTVMAVIAVCDANYGHGVFNKGDRFFFRLKDIDSTIVLSNLLDQKYEAHTETSVTTSYETSNAYCYGRWGRRAWVTPYQVYSLVPEYSTVAVSNSYALYLITKPQLQAILQYGVVKARMEIEDRDLDINDKKGTKIPKFFGKHLDAIKYAVLNPIHRDDF